MTPQSTPKIHDIFDEIGMDIFDLIEENVESPQVAEKLTKDIFDLIRAAKFKDYVPPPKVRLTLTEEIRSLIESRIADMLKVAVSEAVAKIKPRTVETKTVERIVEKTIQTPEKIIEKQVLDDAKLQKAIDEKISKNLDERPSLFVPAPPIIPSWSGKAGKVLSNNGDQLQWVDQAAGTGSGGSSDMVIEYSAADADYYAYAPSGSDPGAAVWKIYRVTTDAEGNSTGQWAEGNTNYDKVATNYASYSYS